MSLAITPAPYDINPRPGQRPRLLRPGFVWDPRETFRQPNFDAAALAPTFALAFGVDVDSGAATWSPFPDRAHGQWTPLQLPWMAPAIPDASPPADASPPGRQTPLRGSPCGIDASPPACARLGHLPRKLRLLSPAQANAARPNAPHLEPHLEPRSPTPMLTMTCEHPAVDASYLWLQ
jgi:hypothetical protein